MYGGDNKLENKSNHKFLLWCFSIYIQSQPASYSLKTNNTIQPRFLLKVIKGQRTSIQLTNTKPGCFPPRQNKKASGFLSIDAGSRFSQTDIQRGKTAGQLVSLAFLQLPSLHVSESCSSLDC